MQHGPTSALRSTLQAAAAARGIALHGAFHANRTELGARGVWNGRAVYVKAFAADSDERCAAELLRGWCAGPVARVLDAGDDLLVLDWVDPGHSLESRYDALGDDRSLAVLADLAATLSKLGATDTGFPTVRVRGTSLLDKARPARIEPDLWRLARERYLALAGAQSRIAVVHGDLHHGNVLADRTRGWVVIDPKGVAAELEFELACALRNPIARRREWANASCMSRRADLLAQRVHVDRERLVRWAFAQSVLAAAWEVEDGLDPSPWIAVSRALASVVANE